MSEEKLTMKNCIEITLSFDAKAIVKVRAM
jgi:hypothetical protein